MVVRHFQPLIPQLSKLTPGVNIFILKKFKNYSSRHITLQWHSAHHIAILVHNTVQNGGLTVLLKPIGHRQLHKVLWDHPVSRFGASCHGKAKAAINRIG